jgi:adenylate cyclase
VGIHTGLAVVGCIGADFGDWNGKPEMRCEYTAIGETINLGQRLEQMTKEHGGPVLLSEATRLCLREEIALISLGPQPVPGFEGELVVHRLQWP